jgi:glycerophosphoryl diester phosphodiesterase
MRTWPYPHLFAHRGGGTLAPENTLAAMQEAVECGYKAVEFDVMLSSDQVPVLMHDPVFGRTVAVNSATDSATDSATNSVAHSTWAELSAMDAGAWHSKRFTGERVPSFDQVIAFCCEHRIAMNIEIKPSLGADVATAIVVAQTLVAAKIKHAELSEIILEPLVSSFSAIALQTFAEQQTGFATGYLMDRMPENWFAIAQALGCKAIHCNYRLLNASIARTIKQQGYWLFCYTVNEPKIGDELLQWGVDGFCTDRLDLFKSKTK